MKIQILAILCLALLGSSKQKEDIQIKQKIKDLKPIVKQVDNAPSQELKFKYYIFEESCYDSFFNKNDFLNFFCLKLTLSKFLGYILVYGALAVKVPQILKIIVNKSVAGISYSSVIIETLMNSLLIGYNLYRKNPFSIYGENVFLGIANLFIVGCYFMFSTDKKYGKYIRGLVILFGVSIPLILQLVPVIVIQNSIWLSIIAFLVSRLEQVRENYRNKSTGNLSFLTVVLNFGGNIARTFTVLTEAGNDIIFLISNALPIVVNGIILLQFILYWNNTITPQSAKQQNKNAKKRD